MFHVGVRGEGSTNPVQNRVRGAQVNAGDDLRGTGNGNRDRKRGAGKTGKRVASGVNCFQLNYTMKNGRERGKGKGRGEERIMGQECQQSQHLDLEESDCRCVAHAPNVPICDVYLFT